MAVVCRGFLTIRTTMPIAWSHQPRIRGTSMIDGALMSASAGGAAAGDDWDHVPVLSASLNRPMPCAYWSQGPHDGWRGWRNATRKRRSPTPDELRSQAMHGLASRITALYWFNLSLNSLLKFPDTWEPMRRIGREIKMLEPFYLEGDAYRFEKQMTDEGKPDWELSSIIAPEAALLFAIDTAYAIDPEQNVFVFSGPREAKFRYDLPEYLHSPFAVMRVDADGNSSS